MQFFDNIRMIRIVSKDHNLLIMEDYMPVLGQVTRSVEFVTEHETISFAPVQGFYMHKKNEFYLLIENHEEEVKVSNSEENNEEEEA